MNEQSVNIERGERARKRRRHLIAALLVIVLVAGAGIGTVYGLLTRKPSGGSAVAQPPPISDTQPAGPSYHAINILLIGVDQRPGDYGRSDTMLLLSMDTDNDRLHILSIPRDTMVDLPGHGTQKINAAYAFGGPQAAKQAVANLTGLPINYYVKVNMQGFPQLVDLLGGVDINVPEKMNYDDPTQNLHIHLEPGLQHLDGVTALEYVRFRHDAEADLGRIKRQQGFLTAIAKQVLKPSILTKLPSLISQTASMLATDIATADKISLASEGYRDYQNGIDTVTLPGDAKYVDGISYVIPDHDKLQTLITSWMAQ